MKKTTKILLIIIAVILLVCLLLWALVSTALIVSADYYTHYSYNIRCTQIGEKIRSPFAPAFANWYRMEGVPAREFVFYPGFESALMSSRPFEILKHKNFDGNLIISAESAKLYTGTEEVACTEENPYGSMPSWQEISEIDKTIVEGTVEELNSTDLLYFDPTEFERVSLEKYSGYLIITFSIEEYETLVWVGTVVQNEQGYFIRVLMGENFFKYLPCDEELSAFIDSVVEENIIKSK